MLNVGKLVNSHLSSADKILFRSIRTVPDLEVAPVQGSSAFESALRRLAQYESISKSIDLVRLLRTIEDDAGADIRMGSRAQEAGAVNHLLGIIRAHEGKVLVVSSALRTLSECFWPRVAADSLACACLLHALQAHIQHASVAREASRAICELVREPANVRLIGPSLPGPMSEVMARHGDDEATSLAFSTIFARLSKVRDAWLPPFLSAGGVEPVLTQLRRGMSKGERPAGTMCSILSELAEHRPSRPILAASDALPLLLEYLRRFGNEAGNARSCIFAIEHISEVEAFSPEQAGLQVALLLKLLRTPACLEREDIAVPACRALAHALVQLTPAEADSSMAAALSLMGATVDAHPESLRGLAAIAFALRRVAACAHCAEPLLREGAALFIGRRLLAPFCDGERAGDGVASLVGDAAEALRSLAFATGGTSGREAILRCGCAVVLIRCLNARAIVLDRRAVTIIMRAIAALAVDESSAAQLLNPHHSYLLPIIEPALFLHHSHRSFVAATCNVLRWLCISDAACEQLLAVGTPGLVVQIAAKHADSPDAVLRPACLAVARLAEFPAMRRHMFASGAGQIVCHLLRQHLDSCTATSGHAGLCVQFLAAGCAALRNLCILPANRRLLMEAGAGELAVAVAMRCKPAQWAALGALFALACERDNCETLQKHGAEMVAAGLDCDCDALDVMQEGRAWAACGILLKLAAAAAAEGSRTRLLHLYEAHGAGAALVRAAVAHVAHPRVLRAAIAALKHFVSEPSIRADVVRRVEEMGESGTAALAKAALWGSLHDTTRSA